MFAFFFPCGLASLLTTSPGWLRHRWHGWHTRYCTCIAAELSCHLCPFAFTSAHLAYHGAHLVELLQELIDLLHSRTAAASNTFAPTSIDDIGGAPLLFRHRENDGLDKFHLVAFKSFFHLWHCCHFVEARNHLHHLSQWTHTFQLTHGTKKIFQVKLALLQFGLGFQRLFLVDGFLRP